MVVDIDVIKSATLFGQSRVGWRGSVIFLFTSIFLLAKFTRHLKMTLPQPSRIFHVFTYQSKLFIFRFFSVSRRSIDDGVKGGPDDLYAE